MRSSTRASVKLAHHHEMSHNAAAFAMHAVFCAKMRFVNLNIFLVLLYREFSVKLVVNPVIKLKMLFNKVCDGKAFFHRLF